MEFGDAFRLAKRGARITSPSWNGKGMWFGVNPGDAPPGMADPPLIPPYTGPELGMQRPSLFLRDATGRESPWVPNMIDLFKDDWELAPGPHGEPVRAWGLDALEVAEREGLYCEGIDADGDCFEEHEPGDRSGVRWIYVRA